MATYFSKRKAAVITGASLILMTILAGMTMGMVFNPLFTTDHVQFSSELEKVKPIFMLGVIGWLFIFVLDLIVSWVLFVFYQDQSRRKAMLMGGLRMVYSIILGVAIVKLFQAAYLIDEGGAAIQAISNMVQSFKSIWQMGLIVFGFHLIALAPLVCKKRSIQMLISALLFLAGIGYVASNVANLLVIDYELYRPKVEMVFIIPMILGEFGLALWLWIKGGKETTPLEK
jgi:hypothetical protein